MVWSAPPAPVSPPYQSPEPSGHYAHSLEFLENHGKNILLSNGNRTALVASYNQGIVVINQPLVPQLLVQVSHTSLSPAPLAPGDLEANSPVERLFSQVKDEVEAMPVQGLAF